MDQKSRHIVDLTMASIRSIIYISLDLDFNKIKVCNKKHKKSKKYLMRNKHDNLKKIL